MEKTSSGKESAKLGMSALALALAAALGLSALAATSFAAAQSTETPDPMELYDANDDGVIDADEAMTAVADHLAGRIDKDLASRVWDLYLAANGQVTGQSRPAACVEYDHNNNGVIDQDEALAAKNDYDAGIIDKEKALTVVSCYFSDPPPPTPTPVPPTATPTPVPPTPTPTPDPLDLYDANDDGVIDADEAIESFSDYLNDRIDRALALKVFRLYQAGSGASGTTEESRAAVCDQYDANNKGGNENDVVDKAEALKGAADYYEGRITRDTAISLVQCYFSDPRPPTGLALSIVDEGGDDLEVTFELSSNSYRHYKFELHSSTGQDGTYSVVSGATQNVSSSPANFDNQARDRWYKARGRNCKTSSQSRCSVWSGWAEAIQIPAPTPTPTALPPPTTPPPTQAPVPTPVPGPVPTPPPQLTWYVEYERNSILDGEWGVLHHSDVTLHVYWTGHDDTLIPASYEFRLTVYPLATGFQVAPDGGCDWTNPPPDGVSETGWFGLPSTLPGPPVATKDMIKPIKLARCGLGKTKNQGFRLERKDGPNGKAVEVMTTGDMTTVRIEQAWHRPAPQVTYWVKGTVERAGGGGISINGIQEGATEGMFPSCNPPPHLTCVDPNAELLNPKNYSKAAGAWNNVEDSKLSITRAASNAGSGVIIQGYRSPNPPSGDDGKCGFSIACTWAAGTYPHIGVGQLFWIEDPPHWGNKSPKIWTTDFQDNKDDPDIYEYLPSVLMHEFGHTFGLGHSARSETIMAGKVRELEPCVVGSRSAQTCGLAEDDQKGAEAIYPATP